MQSRPPSTAAFIGGIVVGLLFGGPILGIATIVLFSFVFASSSSNAYPLISGYVVAIGLGALGIVLMTRKHTNFWTGLLIGAAAGLLGETALCNVILGAGNMH